MALRNTKALAGVMPELVQLFEAVAAKVDFDLYVVEGLRTKAKQATLVAKGASQTQNSRHLTGHAVDIAPFVAGEIRWDWPLYNKLALVVKAEARRLGIKVTWGGDWKSLKDGPHWELDWKAYPVLKYTALTNDLVLDDTPEHQPPPPEETPEAERKLSETRTVKAATTTGAITVLGAAAEGSKYVTDIKDNVGEWITYAPLIFSALALCGVGWIIWNRWQEKKLGRT